MTRATSFDLVTNWHIDAPPERVFDILTDVENLTRWWGAAYLSAELVAEGDENGVGSRAAFATRGALPYKIRWKSETLSIERPHLIELRASGDLQGLGLWTLTAVGRTTHVRYDWRVDLHKPWMRTFAPLLRPVFVWNHDWAMKKGEDGLKQRVLETNQPSGPNQEYSP